MQHILKMLISDFSNVSLSLKSGRIIVVNAAEKQVISAQIKEHRGAVLDLIDTYLKGKFVHLNTIQT